MITSERYTWRNKVTPSLLEKYDQAMATQDKQAQNVILQYRGRFRNLPQNLEVLSALEDQIYVSIPLKDLPTLASFRIVSKIKLPIYSYDW